MAETVEVPVALIEALAERYANSLYGGDLAVQAITCLLPPPPPTFTDEECAAFYRAMWYGAEPATAPATARTLLTRLDRAGYRVVEK